MDRRVFLGGLLAAPAVVRAGSLMPLRGEIIASSWLTGLPEDVIALVDVRRKVKHIMKVDVDSLPGLHPQDLFGTMAQAAVNFPLRDAEFRTSVLLLQYMNIQAIRERNVLVGPFELGGTSFRGIPIQVYDS